jgi:hypothetical protein
MPRETGPTRRFGVFATFRGWLLADADRAEVYESRSDAVATARRLAHLARWRGGKAEVLAQDRPGGTLTVIDPPLGPIGSPISSEPE